MILIVTHDIGFAQAVGDKVVNFVDLEGWVSDYTKAGLKQLKYINFCLIFHPIKSSEHVRQGGAL